MNTPEHEPATLEVLARCGMSLNTFLTPEETVRLPDAVIALENNPAISQHRLYRILRPKTDEEW
jgi:hypothetical protein